MPMIGTPAGLFLKATILKNNNDGTIQIGLDEGQSYGNKHIFNVPIPAAWAGPNGEFIGGYPDKNGTVIVSQGNSGQWYIVSYIASSNTFSNDFISLDSRLMSSLQPGRALMQVKGGSHVFVDPIGGIQAGTDSSFIHADTVRNIFSHNFNLDLSFSEGHRKICGLVKRHLKNTVDINLISSTLDSTAYDDFLDTISLDSSFVPISNTTGNLPRNPPFIENRELTYELSNNFNILTDEQEAAGYDNATIDVPELTFDRRNNRADALSLSLEFPNHLMETITGTVVDAFGNLLDINRNILSIGKINDLSLKDAASKSSAYKKIRAKLRKSIAYHFEINARKGSADPEDIATPDIEDFSDYSRKRSRFFIDIDKEGQFKINIPASSEIGNIPLLSRYENFSVIKASDDDNLNPNEFVKSETNQEIFLDSFHSFSPINLKTEQSLEIPTDRKTNDFMKLGTAYHDISKVCSEFQTSSAFVKAGLPLIAQFPDARINKTITFLPKIVSTEITLEGISANAGGRSGTINLDGFLSLNIGANTIDRQSLWLDCAGGIVSSIGRDKQGISYAGNYDGDILIQIGGNGINSSTIFDSRFNNEDDGFREGALDIRVFTNGGVAILRIDSKGVNIFTPGSMTLMSQQSMILQSGTSIGLEAPMITMHAGSTKRIVNKIGGTI